MIISFYLNGESVEADTAPNRRSVDFLKEEFLCRSLHHRCSDANCGSCLILLDDRPVLSCILPAFELRFRDVWTMEGLAASKGFTDILDGYKAARVQLCPSCAPARALATEALLRQTVRPSAEQIRTAAESVRCGCSSMSRIQDAILRSAKLRERRIDDQ